MEDMKKYTIAVLQDLINTCKEEYSLFEKASKKTEDPELKSLFSAYAQEKKEHFIKLESEIRRLGGSCKINENNSEKLEDFSKSFLHEDTQEDLIAECLKKDDQTIRRYFNAIRKNILWEVVPLVAKQYFGSKNLHDQIRNVCIERVSRPITTSV
jgi:uncharacterized protein (TIGR02284 family)